MAFSLLPVRSGALLCDQERRAVIHKYDGNSESGRKLGTGGWWRVVGGGTIWGIEGRSPERPPACLLGGRLSAWFLSPGFTGGEEKRGVFSGCGGRRMGKVKGRLGVSLVFNL